jgi:hypothetical protein
MSLAELCCCSKGGGEVNRLSLMPGCRKLGLLLYRVRGGSSGCDECEGDSAPPGAAGSDMR